MEQLSSILVGRRGAGEDRDIVYPTLCCAKSRAPSVSRWKEKAGKRMGHPPKWFNELIVNPGGILDTLNSRTGIGSIEPLIVDVK
jgi:hypothetical protein